MGWSIRRRFRYHPIRKDIRLSGVVAPTPAAAAQYYPGNYWYSLIEPPPKSDFPGTGTDGNGISEGLTSQAAWVDRMKQGCQLCHQMGNTHTRVVQHLDDFGLDRRGMGPPCTNGSARRLDEQQNE